MFRPACLLLLVLSLTVATGHGDRRMLNAEPKRQQTRLLQQLQCEPGQRLFKGACVDCRKGAYSTKTNATKCTKCPAGRSTPTAGWSSSTCPVCAAGYGSTDEGTTCTECDKGFFSAGGTTDPCQQCDTGSTTNGTGSATCNLCAPGYGTEKCIICGVGSYSPGNSLKACIKCPKGFRTLQRASTRKAACAVCAPGFGGSSCPPCPDGTFSKGGTKDNCTACNCPEAACKASTCTTTHGNCTLATDPALVDADCTTDKKQKGTCTAKGVCEPISSCVPLDCSAPQYNGSCGVSLSDGCGGVLDCSCSDDYATCSADSAGVVGSCIPCEPKTCDRFIGSCGVEIDDECGGVIPSCNCTNPFDSCSINLPGEVGGCAACVPRTCADLPTDSCGVNIDDGCGGVIASCTCANMFDTCSANGTAGVVGSCKACVPRTCADFPGRCLTDQPDGCGGVLSCLCADLFECIPDNLNDTAGVVGTCKQCFQKTCADLPAGSCGMRINDGCGHIIPSCPCANRFDTCSGNGVLGVLGRCTACVPKTCADFPAGSCFTGVDDGCGGVVSCSCSDPFATCSTSTPGLRGTCRACVPLTCDSTPYAGRCGRALNNSCGGTIAQCSCANQFATCSASTDGVVGSCQACQPLTCSSPAYAGGCGVQLDNKCGGSINCPCTAPNVCSSSAANVLGTCRCVPLTCASPTYAGKCGSSLPNGCGTGTIDCACSGATDICSASGTPGTAGSCICTPRTCSTFYANQCGSSLPNGCGTGTINCPCASASDTCSSTALGVPGTCRCVPKTCASYAGQCGVSLSDGCGGTLASCGCTSPLVCSSTTPGVAGTCGAAVRIDGACKNVPAIPDVIDTNDRATMTSITLSNFAPYFPCYYNGFYHSSCCDLDNGFPGNPDTCTPYTISNGWKEETRKMLNMFRVMSGLTQISFTNATMDDLAAKAALLEAVNVNFQAGVYLNHQPPSTWRCWTQEGYIGTSTSNLAISNTGARAVIGYIHDWGQGNEYVGHRRLLMRPNAQVLGTGDAWPTAAQRQQGYWPANAIWGYDDNNYFSAAPSSTAASRGWYSWPPPGFVPHVLVFTRWHFSMESLPLGNAQSLRSASVAMTCGGAAVAVNVIIPGSSTFGQFIVWEPSIGTLRTDWPSWIKTPPANDIACTVTISGVGSGVGTISYQTTIYYADGSISGLSVQPDGGEVQAASDAAPQLGYLGPGPVDRSLLQPPPNPGSGGQD